MACFLVPAAEAVITTAAAKAMKSSESHETVTITGAGGTVEEALKQIEDKDYAVRIPFSEKLGWLNKMLWGGSALLAFEHVWHGEVVPFFPFLTAVRTGETAGMLAEMGSAGVMMAVTVTAVWGGMVAVSAMIEKRAVSGDRPAGEDVPA